MARHKPMSKAVPCRGESGRPAVVKASLRHDRIAIRFEGARWPHLTLDEAMSLLLWLHDAIDEGYERRRTGGTALTSPFHAATSSPP